jgi:tRNA threonylcarbamoyladenosine biosynthesis protein TsaE
MRVASPAQMRQLGEQLGKRLRPGDVVVLAGPVGAGKTTLTQGIGAGLGIAEHITSPTFVIAREYSGPDARLVHVDAYRLAGQFELEDLDIDTAGAVVVIEWGLEYAAALADDPIVITLDHSSQADERDLQFAEDPRLVGLDP